MGNNSHGNKNEINFIKSLNNKTINDLNDNLKSFIKKLYPNISEKDIIHAQKSKKPKCDNARGNIKPDVTINVCNKKLHISLKIGCANSTHQESTESFLTYLSTKFNISDELANDFRFFVWGDGTLDGGGEILDRLNSTAIINKYPRKVKRIRDFLEQHKSLLIERFVFSGKFTITVDYIYHGDPNKGYWASRQELSNYLEYTGSRGSSIYIGSLTFQTWGRSLNGKNDTRRKYIQVNCSQFKNLVKKICENMNTINNQLIDEYDFVKLNNKNKSYSNPIWQTLCDDLNLNNKLNDIFLVRVSSTAYSKMHNKKIYAKSDSYLVRGTIDNDVLCKLKYYLDEKSITKFNLETIPKSGISLKKPEVINLHSRFF